MPITPEAVERLTRLSCTFADHIDRYGEGWSRARLADICAVLGALEAAQRENERLREALEQAEEWFRDYERQHRAKGTAVGTLKADTNEGRADFCLQARGPDHG